MSPPAQMNQLLQDLVRLLTLERLEINLFRGESRDMGSAQVFGGQVLGQALVAASMTVEGRFVHSLHAYFLRRGDFNAPIVYEVDRARDGAHFSTRRILAIQHGEQIFNMAASFQAPEQGLEHQAAMPQVAAAESLQDSRAYYQHLVTQMPERLRRWLERKSPFEFRPVQRPGYLSAEPLPPAKQVWFRAVDRLPDDEALHRCLLAYASDFNLLDTAMRPHGVSHATPGIAIASIDHAMWFHHPVRVDEWLLYSTDSPSASGARGFARGSIFSADGRLLASTAQEGLMRVAAR
jgi:acyl-CoA thioesterase II